MKLPIRVSDERIETVWFVQHWRTPTDRLTATLQVSTRKSLSSPHRSACELYYGYLYLYPIIRTAPRNYTVLPGTGTAQETDCFTLPVAAATRHGLTMRGSIVGS